MKFIFSFSTFTDLLDAFFKSYIRHGGTSEGHRKPTARARPKAKTAKENDVTTDKENDVTTDKENDVVPRPSQIISTAVNRSGFLEESQTFDAPSPTGTQGFFEVSETDDY